MTQLNTADRLFLGNKQIYRAYLQGTRVWPKQARVRNLLDGGTDGASITPGNSGGASGDAFDQTIGATLPIYSSTQKRAGLAARMSTGATSAQCYVAWNAALGTTTTNWYGKAYLYFAAASQSAALATARYFEFRNSSALAGYFRPTTNGPNHYTEIADSSGSIVKLGTVSWTLNQLIRVEWHMIHSATVGLLEVKLFNTATATTPDETVTASNINTGAAALNSVRIGATTSVTNFPATGGFMYADELDVGAQFYPGP